METQLFLMNSIQKTLEDNLRESISLVIIEMEKEIHELYNKKREDGVSLGVKRQINGKF